ncbi:MAG: glycoside hydrolase family 25 protein [Butyrivibrio sp.]|nr:glycoside hydrolase family 25 protein [Butyrivibrio sp.]
MSNNLQDNREKKGVSNTRNIISIIFLSLVAIMALTFSIILLIKNATLQREEAAIRSELEAMDKEDVYTETEISSRIEEAKVEAAEKTEQSMRDDVRKMLEEGKGAAATIRAFFPDNIVVGSDGRYYFLPISDKIAHHGFTEQDFELDDKGFLRYKGSDKSLKVKQGIDVSRFQGEIDWAQVAKDGIEFAYIRVGYRGSTEGAITIDDTFEANIQGAIENGIDVGVYFYSQAINEEEALEEAKVVLETISQYETKYPVVLDVESADSDAARTNNLSSEQYEKVVDTFCKAIEDAGHKSMVYGNLKTFTLLVNAEHVDDKDIWIAYYDQPLYYPYYFNIWQYSSKGKVAGIEGNVDLNICLTEYGE